MTTSAPFTLDGLRSLHARLVELFPLSATNCSEAVECIRKLSEHLLWGDQHGNEDFFMYFCEENVMILLTSIFTGQQNNDGVKEQILQSLHILLQNISNQKSLFYLFSRNRINNLLEYQISLENEDLVSWFASFIKSVSLRLNAETVGLFYNEGAPTFPLYSQAIRLFAHDDRMVRTHMQSVTLNVYKAAKSEKSVLTFIRQHPQFFRYLAAMLRNLWHQVEITSSTLTLLDDEDSLGNPPTCMSVLDEVEDLLLYINDILAMEVKEISEILWEYLLSEAYIPLLLKPLMLQHQEANGKKETQPFRWSSAVSSSTSSGGYEDVAEEDVSIHSPCGGENGTEKKTEEETPQESVNIRPTVALYLVVQTFKTIRNSLVIRSLAHLILSPSIPSDILEILNSSLLLRPESAALVSSRKERKERSSSLRRASGRIIRWCSQDEVDDQQEENSSCCLNVIREGLLYFIQTLDYDATLLAVVATIESVLDASEFFTSAEFVRFGLKPQTSDVTPLSESRNPRDSSLELYWILVSPLYRANLLRPISLRCLCRLLAEIVFTWESELQGAVADLLKLRFDQILAVNFQQFATFSSDMNRSLLLQLYEAVWRCHRKNLEKASVLNQTLNGLIDISPATSLSPKHLEDVKTLSPLDWTYPLTSMESLRHRLHACLILRRTEVILHQIVTSGGLGSYGIDAVLPEQPSGFLIQMKNRHEGEDKNCQKTTSRVDLHLQHRPPKSSQRNLRLIRCRIVDRYASSLPSVNKKSIRYLAIQDRQLLLLKPDYQKQGWAIIWKRIPLHLLRWEKNAHISYALNLHSQTSVTAPSLVVIGFEDSARYRLVQERMEVECEAAVSDLCLKMELYLTGREEVELALG